jgi:hypothetical protein
LLLGLLGCIGPYVPVVAHETTRAEVRGVIAPDLGSTRLYGPPGAVELDATMRHVRREGLVFVTPGDRHAVPDIHGDVLHSLEAGEQGTLVR